MENGGFSLFSIFFKIQNMATNSLSLNIPDIMTDCVLRIEDTSIYDPLMPYICPTVQVLVPGYKDCVTFNDTTVPAVGANFILNLSACNLKVQTNRCGDEFYPLPDGIYVIKYALSPHDKMYVEYNHLRVTALRKQLKEEWCKLKLSACEPIPETEDKFNALMEITGYIDAAKAKAEYCLKAEEAMVLYNYAKKLLDKFSCKLC
jgi:hypothetical protein